MSDNPIFLWAKAARLRTLPLALAVSGAGNVLALNKPFFSFQVCVWSLLTTILLQILSNFANDLGDSIHGADHSMRQGPKRTVQAGLISKVAMKRAVIMLAILSLLAGLVLLWVAFHQYPGQFLVFLLLGLLAIAGAYFYTNGKKPYGYVALGDLAVFFFFGPLAVWGTYFLHSHTASLSLLLPSVSFGCWSVAVLNLNNMRDMESDLKAGKLTIPIKIGLHSAKNYQIHLILWGIVSLIAFSWIEKQGSLLLFAIGLPFMVFGVFAMVNTKHNSDLDRLLKPQALGTLFATIGMLAGQLFFP